MFRHKKIFSSRVRNEVKYMPKRPKPTLKSNALRKNQKNPRNSQKRVQNVHLLDTYIEAVRFSYRSLRASQEHVYMFSHFDFRAVSNPSVPERFPTAPTKIGEYLRHFGLCLLIPEKS
jgi:hypothetical protein